MIEKHVVPMQFHPRAFSAFGSDLVTNDFVAVNELVKNSYDAYAYNVMLSINEDTNGECFIEIVDDGFGMTQKIVEEAWAIIATPYKKNNPIVERDGKIRIVSGNKGLGRLSSARLGNKLEILTKSNSEECIFVNIDWRALVESSDISLCGIEIDNGNEKYLLDKIDKQLKSSSKTGTIIRIRELNEKWGDEKLRGLEQALARLISPFDDISDFKIFLGVSGNVPVRIAVHDFIKIPTYHFWGEVDENGDTKWNYRYHSSQSKEESGKFSWEESYGGFGRIGFQNQIFDLEDEKYKCGKFTFELRAWDLDTESIGVISSQFDIKKNEIRKTISIYKGLSIYRDNVLVLPKSDASKDWLGVDLRRVSNIGRRLSTNQIIGKISISEHDNPELKDTTDREKLVDTKEYTQFCYIMETAIMQLENLRNRDKTIAKKPSKLIDLITPLNPSELDIRVEELVRVGKNEEVIDLVHEYSANAEKSIGELKDRMDYYAQTASLGSVAFVIMHEIRTGMMTVKRFLAWFKREIVTKDNIGMEYCDDAMTAHSRLLEVANSFSPLYRKKLFDEKSTAALDNAVKDSINLIKAKKEANGVDFKNEINKGIVIGMHSGEIQTILLNLLDNACYWLSRMPNKKTIKIKTSIMDKKVYVNVSDNGPGINEEDVEKIFSPGITGKPQGIGMGLVIATELLSHYDCKIETRVPGDIGGATFIFELPLSKEV